ncbi:aminofutalosine synthase MqnE [Planctomycetales bacterium ZRK34]|nr:aminofutalosine synthase MqnE [Planctomycetales bacterium ZRK34]
MDAQLQKIANKVEAGERLDAADARVLFDSRDVWTIGRLADSVRRRLHGNVTYYNVNRHFNYSNVCALSCKFCDFYRKKGQTGAYEFSLDDVRAKAAAAKEAGATEIHIVGGLHPWLPFEYYTDMCRAVHEVYPELHIKAFTAVEIVHLARISKRGRDIDGVLTDLKEAGLGSLPGGGAEVFDDRVHDEAFKGKIRSDQWLAVHNAAHRVGLMSNATMLYGHIESIDDRINHLIMLRDAQDLAIENGWAGRFQTVIPLPFIPGESELKHLPGPTALDDLKMLAISRLMLDNFAHVKSFWIMQTLEFSQLALSFGVDDIDGTVVWYDITKVQRDGDTHQELTVADLRDTIIEAGFVPVERDTLYRRIRRDGPDWQVIDAAAELTPA